MKTKLIEATNEKDGEHFNWGKFCVAQFDAEELAIPSKIDGRYLITTRGWTADHLWVMDLQTGEGACFRLGGCAPADLEKHAVWVCPLFQPFLAWLYQQDFTSVDELPDVVNLPDAPGGLQGYRRSGPKASP